MLFSKMERTFSSICGLGQLLEAHPAQGIAFAEHEVVLEQPVLIAPLLLQRGQLVRGGAVLLQDGAAGVGPAEYSVQGLMGHFNPALPYTLEEMQSYGFYFSPYRHARPYIRPYMLGEIFGQYADEVMQKYLVREHDGSYTLLPEVNTQRKIEQLMEQEPDETRRTTIRNGLFALVADVLFLEDPQRKNHWHPRISAQYTYGYKALSDYEKWCFNRLYDEFFYKRHDEFWKQEALKKLPPLISSTRMLVCGEDLGMIPHCVPEVMHKLQILSLEIQRMPKEANHNFADTWHYPYLSVCTTSTHDMSTLRAWWEENREQTQQFYNHVLHLQGEAPTYCEPWICEKIIDMQLESPSMWVILPLQDWLSTDGAMAPSPVTLQAVPKLSIAI